MLDSREMLYCIREQSKLKRLLQYLDFKDIKMSAMKDVALDDNEPSETGGELLLLMYDSLFNLLNYSLL